MAQHANISIMNNVFLRIIAVAFLSLLVTPQVALAQYKGSIDTKPKVKIDPAATPVAKIFSSQVTSTEQAQRLDTLYDNLLMTLRNYAQSDVNYQSVMLDLVKVDKFQLTRYEAEFVPTMKNSMKNLNKNYKSMMADIENAKTKYQEIREGIRAEDHEALDPLWNKKIEDFTKVSDTYFKMQHNFMKTYRNLVGFILKQGGSYAYKQGEGIKFYKFGGYQYFGKSVDKLRKIQFEQRKHLNANAPAAATTVSLK